MSGIEIVDVGGNADPSKQVDQMSVELWQAQLPFHVLGVVPAVLQDLRNPESALKFHR
jgi:hypothetical protein